jgi:hypothetical protein
VGGIGTRGDCGYKYLNNVTHNDNGTVVTSLCPFEKNLANLSQPIYCSGHGSCLAFSQTCSCDAGYGE